MPNILRGVAWTIFVLGNLLNFVSFSYASQTVLSSIGSVQFIANVIFIYILFKVSPTKQQLFGTLCVVIGNICIVLVANKSTYQVNSKELIQLFAENEYIAYLISILCLSIIIQVCCIIK